MDNLSPKKILFLCPASQTVYHFRVGLIQYLKAQGMEIEVVCFDGKYKSDLEKLGISIRVMDEDNRGTNPMRVLALRRRYTKIIKEIAPDVVFTFMLKPNIFGTLGARSAGVKRIFSMVEGAGDVFINNGLKWKLIRFFVSRMMKKAFKSSEKVFFLNEDDKNEFIDRGIVKKEQCEIIHGVGINLEKFTPTPVKNHKTFLMIARMLKTKGVYEYCEAARIVKKKYPDAVFNYLGGEGSLKLSDVKEYIDEGTLNYLGVTKDVRPYIEECSVNVLPSYREGLGLVNVEAGSCGRPSITCDTYGTKDTVKDGYNGFLVPVKDAKALADKMIWFIENPDQIEIMGKNSRKFAEENFDQRLINRRIHEIIG